MKNYLNAFGGLYGNTCLEVKKRKQRKKPIYEEDNEQIILVTWLRMKNVPFYHVPNQRQCSKIQGAKFKRLGVAAGVPDICIPIASNSKHGMYIELKRKDGGIVSPMQKYWLDLLNEQNYLAIVANGAEAAKIKILEYLEDII